MRNDSGGTSKKSTALFGTRAPTKLSLRELVAEKTKYMIIEEDIYKRANWNAQIAACAPYYCSEEDGNKENVTENVGATKPVIDGAYRFCYRDYVNHEEVLAMLCRRWSVERALFRPAEATEFLIEGVTGKCKLKERGLMFGFIPVAITWYGQLVTDKENIKCAAIHWDSTELKLGWTKNKFFKYLGTTVDRPAAAEKLRVDPWNIKLNPKDSNGDIICFMREGKGHLIFAKHKCLNQVTAAAASVANAVTPNGPNNSRDQPAITA
jgi:hypothetical protein